MKLILLTNSICKYFGLVASDSYLWKRLYAERFFQPRKNTRRLRLQTSAAYHHAVQPNSQTWGRVGTSSTLRAWKSRYKVRHKWSKGLCHYREINLANPGLPRVLLRIHNGIAITADQDFGLRAWAITARQQSLLARFDFHQHKLHGLIPRPSCLAIDTQRSTGNPIHLAIGFVGGDIGIYLLDVELSLFTHLQSFSAYAAECVLSLDFGSAHVLALSESQVLTLHRLSNNPAFIDISEPPTLLTSFKSYTAGELVSLSFRKINDIFIISMAYIHPTFFAGWNVGFQEFSMTLQGVLLRSRSAQNRRSGASSTSTTSSQLIRNSGISHDTSQLNAVKPVSIEYSHPYLLTTHADNTLGVCLVRSSEAELTISRETRLWGHTSRLTGAQIGDRGKIVTIAQGRDVRVWELEEAFRLSTSKAGAPSMITSVKIRPEALQYESQGSRSTQAPSLWTNAMIQAQIIQNSDHEDDLKEARPIEKASLAFDEEKLVVLHDTGTNSQSLFVYDFT